MEAADQPVIQAGDAATWYRANVDSVYGYVARRVGEQLATDLVAETFRIALEQRERFDPDRGSERAWLLGIATNLVRRHWRTETRRLRAWSRYAVAADVPGTDPLLAVDARVDATVEVAALFDAVAALPADDRDLLILVAWEGCSYRDAAEIAGVPTGTIRSRLHRIRRTLHSLMGERGQQGGEHEHG
ncbi:MAG: RNA polymerase sigma factor [Ilumatobacteraceae bacterium]